MSYDCYLMIDTGGDEPGCVADLGNYTYNCSAMLVKAMGDSLSSLNGKSCTEVWPLLENAIHEMRLNPKDYIALNPANGWGRYESWVEYLEKIAIACKKNPKCYLKVS